jgi:hypothetical protein
MNVLSLLAALAMIASGRAGEATLAQYALQPTVCPPFSLLAAPGGTTCFALVDQPSFDYNAAQLECKNEYGPNAHLAAPVDASERRAVEAMCTTPFWQNPLPPGNPGGIRVTAWMGVMFSVADFDAADQLPAPSTYKWRTSTGGDSSFFTAVNGGARDWWSSDSSRIRLDGLHFPPLPNVAVDSPVLLPFIDNSTCVILNADARSQFPWVPALSSVLMALPCYEGLPSFSCCSFPSFLNGTAVMATNSPPRLLGLQRPATLLVPTTTLPPYPNPRDLLPSPTGPQARGTLADPIPIQLPADESLHYPGILLYAWASDVDSPEVAAGSLSFSMVCSPTPTVSQAPLPLVIDRKLGWVTATASLVSFVTSTSTCTISVVDGMGAAADRNLTFSAEITNGYPAISAPPIIGWRGAGSLRSYSYIEWNDARPLTYSSASAKCISLGAQLPSPDSALDLRAFWMAATSNGETETSTFLSQVRRASENTVCGYVSLPFSFKNLNSDPCTIFDLLSFEGVPLFSPEDAASSDFNDDCLMMTAHLVDNPDDLPDETRPIEASIAAESCTTFMRSLVCEVITPGLSYVPNQAPVIGPPPPRGTTPFIPSGSDAYGNLRFVAPGVRLGGSPCSAGPDNRTAQCAVPQEWPQASLAPVIWSMFVPEMTPFGSELINLAFLGSDVDTTSALAYRAGRLVFSFGPFAPSRPWGAVDKVANSPNSNGAGLAGTSMIPGSPIELSINNPPGTLLMGNMPLTGLWRNATQGWGVFDVALADGFGATAGGYVRMHVIITGCDATCRPALKSGQPHPDSEWEAVPCTSLTNRLCLPRSAYPPPIGLSLLAVYVLRSGLSQPILPGSKDGVTIAEGDPQGWIAAFASALILAGATLALVSMALNLAVVMARTRSCSSRCKRLTVCGRAVTAFDFPATILYPTANPAAGEGGTGRKWRGMQRTIAWLVASTILALLSHIFSAIITGALFQAVVLSLMQSGIVITRDMEAKLRPAGSTWALPASPPLLLSLAAAGVLNADSLLQPPPWTQFKLRNTLATSFFVALGLILWVTSLTVSTRRALASPWGRRLRSTFWRGSEGPGPSRFILFAAVLLDCLSLRNGACALFAARAASGGQDEETEGALPMGADGATLMAASVVPVVTPRGLWLQFFLEGSAGGCFVVACVCAGVGVTTISTCMFFLTVWNCAYTASVEDPWVVFSTALTCCSAHRRSFAKRRLSGLTAALERSAAAVVVARVKMEATIRRIEEAEGLEHVGPWFANPVVTRDTSSTATTESSVNINARAERVQHLAMMPLSPVGPSAVYPNPVALKARPLPLIRVLSGDMTANADISRGRSDVTTNTQSDDDESERSAIEFARQARPAWIAPAQVRRTGRDGEWQQPAEAAGASEFELPGARREPSLVVFEDSVIDDIIADCHRPDTAGGGPGS